MRRILATIALCALLPGVAAAQQITLNVRNCATMPIRAQTFYPNSNMPSQQAVIDIRQTAALLCETTACFIHITYYQSHGPTGRMFTVAYSTDRCTRGPDDMTVGELPEIGSCGC